MRSLPNRSLPRYRFSARFAALLNVALLLVMASLAPTKASAQGDPDVKVTNLDVDVLSLNLKLLRQKEVEAETGILKAIAAVREAVGVGPEYPLHVADGRLPALVQDLNKDALIAMALANRGEIT